MTAKEQISDFIATYNDRPNPLGSRPNWIRVFIQVNVEDGQTFHCVYDFKNDPARKAFGALCHRLYTDRISWVITTRNNLTF